MPEVSEADLRRMRNSFRFDVAQRLAAVAGERRTITYGELTDEFGIPTRSWGWILGGIALRCHKEELPILSVLAVNKATGLPSPAARLYRDLGIDGDDAMRAEQQRCLASDWTKTLLARG